MNEILRRALLSAQLDEVDVATRLEVDPKTVRRWLEGRLPYARHRWALADLLKLSETDVWPELRATQSRPDELLAVYPHRSSIPREIWRNLFASAEYEISVLAYSSLFLAEDAEIIRILSDRARNGVRVHIALGDPSSFDTPEGHSQENPTTNAVTKTCNALTLYQPLRGIDRVEIRLHRAALHNSIYRADDELLCNQHVFGVPVARGPVLHLQRTSSDGMASAYLDSFERIWSKALPDL